MASMTRAVVGNGSFDASATGQALGTSPTITDLGVLAEQPSELA